MQNAVVPMQVVARVTAAIFGGWLFTWGFAGLTISGLVTLGVSYDHAATGTMLFAFLIFLSALLWSFVATSVVRVWLTLAGGGAIMTAVAWSLQRWLIG